MSAVPLRKKAPPRPLATASPSEPGLLTIPQAARRLGVSPRTAYIWARNREMPGLIQINSRYYVKRAALELFLDER